MRIERVTADTFSEASDRARQRYGSDALILSTSKVGNVTELLVCVDAEDDGFVPAPGFRDELTSQIAKVVPKRPEPSTQEQLQAHVKVSMQTARKPEAAPAANAAPAAAVDGSALVKVIRQELQALEKRLSTSAGANTLVRERMALLEQGVSANYAMRLVEHANDIAAMAQQLLADLQLTDVKTSQPFSSDGHSCCVVGPAGAGKTTLAIQLAADTGMVQSWRDKRPGSRERFFAMADRAGIDAGWGAIAPAHAVIDTAGLTLGELEEKWQETASHRNIILALPATMSRAEASRWLQSSLPIAGVVITHWDNARMPLGLLATIAESSHSLCGVSSSSDPSDRVQAIDVEAINQGLSLILQLVLSEPQHATE